jgi:hypothetical protein
MIDEIIRNLNLEVRIDYIDDIIIGSDTFKQYLKDLKQISQKLKQAELCLKIAKCYLLRTESNSWSMN